MTHKIVHPRIDIVFVLIVAAIILIGMAVPADAFPEIGTCINDTHLRTSVILNVSGTEETIVQDDVFCPLGCNVNATQYGAACESYDQGSPTLLVIWLAMYAFLAGLWRVGYKIPAAVLMLANSLVGLWITQSPVILIPMAISILLLYSSVQRVIFRGAWG